MARREDELMLAGIIRTCGKAREWQACVEAVATMLMLRLVPSIYSFTAAIAASLGAWMAEWPRGPLGLGEQMLLARQRALF
eukprot:s4240_g4.t1